MLMIVLYYRLILIICNVFCFAAQCASPKEEVAYNYFDEKPFTTTILPGNEKDDTMLKGQNKEKTLVPDSSIMITPSSEIKPEVTVMQIDVHVSNVDTVIFKFVVNGEEVPAYVSIALRFTVFLSMPILFSDTLEMYN